MENLSIDINCDMGESYGRFVVGNDEAIFPYITSCNIACGFHGGDPLSMEYTIKSALKHGVRIGAHPSYPDLAGFGRRKMFIAKNELKAILKYQVSALKGMVESLGGLLAYLKPHGALYNSAAKNMEESETIAKSILEINQNIALMGPSGSEMELAANKYDLRFIAEAFADRRYEPDGSLRSRNKKGAVIKDPNEAAAQVISIIKEKRVKTHSGEYVPIHAQSICIHGDHPNAFDTLKAIDVELIKYGIRKKI